MTNKFLILIQARTIFILNLARMATISLEATLLSKQRPIKPIGMALTADLTDTEGP
jgi:hypothetical protein